MIMEHTPVKQEWRGSVVPCSLPTGQGSPEGRGWRETGRVEREGMLGERGREWRRRLGAGGAGKRVVECLDNLYKKKNKATASVNQQLSSIEDYTGWLTTVKPCMFVGV